MKGFPGDTISFRNMRIYVFISLSLTLPFSLSLSLSPLSLSLSLSLYPMMYHFLKSGLSLILSSLFSETQCKMRCSVSSPTPSFTSRHSWRMEKTYTNRSHSDPFLSSDNDNGNNSNNWEKKKKQKKKTVGESTTAVDDRYKLRERKNKVLKKEYPRYENDWIDLRVNLFRSIESSVLSRDSSRREDQGGRHLPA